MGDASGGFLLGIVSHRGRGWNHLKGPDGGRLVSQTGRLPDDRGVVARERRHESMNPGGQCRLQKKIRGGVLTQRTNCISFLIQTYNSDRSAR